jgi:hypothetical protein
VYDLVLKAESNFRIQTGTGAAAISITTANNVGIGKTNPNIAYKLEVVDDVNITGAYRITNTAITGKYGLLTLLFLLIYIIVLEM